MKSDVMKKCALLLLCLSVLSIGAVSAGGRAPADEGAEHVWKVGYLAFGLDSEHHKIMQDTFKSLADANPQMEVLYADPNRDQTTQIEMFENFMVQGIEILVVGPASMENMVDSIKKANERGIPVICLSLTSAEGKFTQVGVDDYEIGKMQGEYFAEVLPQDAKVLYLRGFPHIITTNRRNGFYDGLASRTDVEVLSDQECNYDTASAMRVTEDWIQAYPEFDAIAACNDLAIMGALEALKGAHRQEGIILSGIDANEANLIAIKNGEIAQSVAQDWVGQGTAAYNLVVDAMAGKTLPDAVMVPVINVTAENVDDFL